MPADASTPSVSDGFQYEIFGLDVHLQDYKDLLDTERFGVLPSNGDAKTVYDALNGLDRVTVLDA